MRIAHFTTVINPPGHGRAICQLVLSALAGVIFSLSAKAAEDARPLRIGADQTGESALDADFAAVRLYDRALAAGEIAALAMTKADAPQASFKPIHEWLFGRFANGRVADTAGGGKPVDLTTPSKPRPRVQSAVSCIPLRGGYFDAVVPGFNAAADFSQEVWIHLPPDALRTEGRITDRITPGSTDGCLFDIHGGRVRLMAPGAADFAVPVCFDGWVHLVMVRTGAKLALFINGRTAAEFAATTKVAPRVPLQFIGEAAAPTQNDVLWWRAPAAANAWTQAMPLGNGRLGVMQEGGVESDTLWLNEDTLWSGEPFTPTNTTALKALPEVRRLLIERKDGAATNLVNQSMLGINNEAYMPMGQLLLRFPKSGKVENYLRTLDLMTGIASIRYQQDGVRYSRETLVSHPDQAVVLRLAADKPGQVTFDARLKSQLKAEIHPDAKVLRMSGRAPTHADPHYAGTRVVFDTGENPKGMRFEVDVFAIADNGKVVVEDGVLSAKNCDAVTLVLVAATSYNGFDKSPSRDGKDPAELCAAYRKRIEAKPEYSALRKRHADDVSALMNRVQLSFDPPSAGGKAESRPTSARVGGGFQAADVAGLAALYYQFGRYLLVSSSRPGTQAANLQGIWNRSINPPWSCNYTTNCNVEFNYLGVEAANLHELHEPFLRLIKEWSVDGARTARTWYGCGGWVGHHNCDLWRNACPSGGNALWAMFPGATAWVCQEFWEDYAFSLDRASMRAHWPTLRGACEFYLDFLIKDPKTGHLVVAPDTNFENSHNRGGSMTMGATPTNMMVRQLFANAIAASKILDVDAPLRARMEAAMAQLPPTRVDAKSGELMEYLDDGVVITNRGSCELLSAWGAIWCDQITPSRTPGLVAALRKAYEAPDRRPWITGQVGSWQGAFPANTFARFGDGNRVEEILSKHFQHIVLPNFTAGFIQSEWEIDGNLGIMAAIGEMLLHSHELRGHAKDGTPEYTLALLPALPTGPPWANGSVRGLKARGNITVDITWKNGKVTGYQLRSPDKRPVQVRVNGEIKTVTPE